MQKKSDLIAPSPIAPGGAQSIGRAVTVLRAVATMNHDGASVSEVASALKLDRTTTHRILKALAAHRMLGHTGQPRRYYLGALTYQLGLVAGERLDLRKLCAPAMARIAAETGDTVFLMVREGQESVCADRKSGDFPVKTFVVEVGTRRPLGIGAGSLAILAALPADEAEASIIGNADRIRAYKGMNEEVLRKMVLKTRVTHEASMDVIDVEGVHAVAVPIREPGGMVIAAFSIAAISPRMTHKRRRKLFEVLRREAAHVTAHLGSEAWMAQL
ncbi:MAG: IclR family transcriptional regulator [Burkholderiaceae bacterium]|nr:IclR family transcriptional regulator [Burkholderiaceae bacterium]MDO9089192.1 IclR family transcriptional regulator [Burkholderiaceae bacterium]